MAKPNRAMPGPFSGLSVKIIATIIVVILAVEVVIYLPSAANFRQSWLNDRLRVGVVAARVLDRVGQHRQERLEQMRAIAVGQREQSGIEVDFGHGHDVAAAVQVLDLLRRHGIVDNL